MSKLRTLCVFATTALLAAACAGGDGTIDDDRIEAGDNAPAPPRGDDDDDDDDDTEPPAGDAYSGLPACEGAEESYAVGGQTSVEVVDFYGPNVSLRLGTSGEVAVIYPAVEDYGTGIFKLDAADEWTVELCVDWDDDLDVCDRTLGSVAGTLTVDSLTESDTAGYEIAGTLSNVVFVDDADDPTCAVRVSWPFDYPTL